MELGSRSLGSEAVNPPGLTFRIWGNTTGGQAVLPSAFSPSDRSEVEPSRRGLPFLCTKATESPSEWRRPRLRAIQVVISRRLVAPGRVGLRDNGKVTTVASVGHVGFNSGDAGALDASVHLLRCNVRPTQAHKVGYGPHLTVTIHSQTGRLRWCTQVRLSTRTGIPSQVASRASGKIDNGNGTSAGFATPMARWVRTCS